MMKTLSRWYRVGATTFCFGVFMTGGALLSLTILPATFLLPLPKKRKHVLCRFIIHRSFDLFMRMMAFTGCMSYQLVDVPDENEPCLYVANHPCLVDVVALVGGLRNCNCIVKSALWRHPFMAMPVHASGFVPNHEASQLIEACGANFRDGHSLLVFPEGTRSPPGGLGEFNRGAAQIALRNGVPIVPVVVTCNPPTLLKGQRWYKVPDRPFRLELKFKPAIQPERVVADQPTMPLKVRALTHYMREYFKRELGLP